MDEMLYTFERPEINPNEIPGRKDLVDYFNRKDIMKYLEIFPKTVNFAFFKTMGEDDFMEYGISKESDMTILMDAVTQAQEEEDAEQNDEDGNQKNEEDSADGNEVCKT